MIDFRTLDRAMTSKSTSLPDTTEQFIAVRWKIDGV